MWRAISQFFREARELERRRVWRRSMVSAPVCEFPIAIQSSDEGLEVFRDAASFRWFIEPGHLRFVEPHRPGGYRRPWGFTVTGQRLEAFAQDNDIVFPMGLKPVGAAGAAGGVTSRARRLMIQHLGKEERSRVSEFRRMDLRGLFDAALARRMG